ncbi:TetR family transcriptional regulator [Nonomuraea longispora]|uniref:TetR family transcriptional regulator n=1 Tax=Nonomuraea longispora TaxID=1848320 RepID=A0A4R4MR70_9ACTN|nr:TetR family transcriptional regulator [Nonomuraea longispora]TDB98478.1 TetR family transcriptional regulator [Nonomuraea longispora]
MGNGGLRERKKARTKETILREAFRLFRERGYNATTIDQIAEAAEVSPATFFRYFPTKEDLVTLDGFPPFIEALHVQPPGPPVTVLRGAFRTAFDTMTPEEIAAGHEREVFAATVPELVAANLRKSPGVLRQTYEILAGKTGCDAGDPRLRNAVGAVFGVVTLLWLQWAHDPGLDGPAEIDRALEHLESGLPL